MPDEDWWRALWPDPEGVLRAIGAREGMTAVDLCCGNGWFTAPLAHMLGQGRVHAVDLDPAMIRAARRRLAGQEAPDCNWITGDARRMGEMIPDPVDLVLIANTFHGVPDKTGLAKAARDVLKPGGLFTVINWHARPREETTVLGAPRGPATRLRMTPQAVRAAVEPAGFTFKKTVELPPYHYGAVFRRP